MRGGKWVAGWWVILALVVLVWGAGRLLEQRYASGDVYPVYSSLRADPLGLKALHDALSEMAGRRVSRFTATHLRFPSGKDTVMIFAGLDPWNLEVEEEEFRVLERFVREGGRLVMTYRSEAYEVKPGVAAKGGGRPAVRQPAIRDLKVEWGCPDKVVELERETKKEGGLGGGGAKRLPAEVKRAEGVDGLVGSGVPETLQWHSPGVFEKLSPEWTKILIRESAGGAVMVERRMGLGSIVVGTDTYWLSNEAMRRGPQLGLVQWALGGAGMVVFDESHLGTVESMGVMTMIRSYRLHLFLGVLFLIAGLGVWRLALSFVPRGVAVGEEGGRGEMEVEVVAAMDAGTGLANLLRRSVGGAELLSVCLAEWLRSGKGGRSIPPEKLACAEAVIQRENEVIEKGGKTNPVLVYREIAAVVRPLARGWSVRNNKSAKG